MGSRVREENPGEKVVFLWQTVTGDLLHPAAAAIAGARDQYFFSEAG
jgi:hypothetical protein